MYCNSHINQDYIERIVSEKDDFAIVNIVRPEGYHERKNASRNFICPITLKNGEFAGREGLVFDDCDFCGERVMTREQMLMEFELMTGKRVEYEIDEVFPTSFSTEFGSTISNFRRISD